MIPINSIASLRSLLLENRKIGRSIGFVPTMGALHSGHGSLITHSIREGHFTIVSIYVNPTQFNDPEDLKKYPRPLIDDLDYLSELGCNVVFLPTDKEIYPDSGYVPPEIDLGYLGSTLEAAFRPGHFEGVLQVMHRFLNIIQTDFLYMGKKDLQQLAVVRRLIVEYDFDCQLVGLPIVREANGLARSSRNERLSPSNRNKATAIYETLMEVHETYKDKTLRVLKDEALNQLSQPPFRVEYFEFVRSDNLKILHKKDEYRGPVTAVTAVWCESVRLIDNMEMDV